MNFLCTRLQQKSDCEEILPDITTFEKPLRADCKELTELTVIVLGGPPPTSPLAALEPTRGHSLGQVDGQQLVVHEDADVL